MGRTPCCDQQLGLKKGPWTPEEDKVLLEYIQANGHGSWRSLPKLAGLQRCGKSCRLRWTNYLRPDIKRGPFTTDEQKSIIQLHGIVGNKWSTIAAQLPGRTDNEIKNYWNTHLKKRLLRMGINPETCYAASSSSPLSPSTSSSAAAGLTTTTTSSSSFSTTRHMAQWESARLEAEARLSRQSLLFSRNAASASGPNAASAAISASADMSEEDNPEHKKEPVDIFLRMWSSDVGTFFRRKKTAPTSTDSKAKNEEAESSPASSSCNTKQSSALTVSEVNNAEACATVESRSSNGTAVVEAEEDNSDETYQFYLDLAAGDELSLFQNHQQHLGSSYYSWFGNDLNEASLDNPFK